MKRDPRLHGLSSDHHHALVLARTSARAARPGESRTPDGVWKEIVRRFAREVEPHFLIEERHLLPAMRAIGEDEIVARTLAEHAALRDCVDSIEGAHRERLARFGELLTAHVRFEERVLFEVAQEKLGDEALDTVAAASRSQAETKEKVNPR